MRVEVIELGAKLRQRRQVLRLSQSQLATLSGISARTIQLVEQGKGNPGLDTLVQLADSLGVRLELLLKSGEV